MVTRHTLFHIGDITDTRFWLSITRRHAKNFWLHYFRIGKTYHGTLWGLTFGFANLNLIMHVREK